MHRLDNSIPHLELFTRIQQKSVYKKKILSFCNLFWYSKIISSVSNQAISTLVLKAQQNTKRVIWKKRIGIQRLYGNKMT